MKCGEFANAFRVVDEVGPDCFLDFLIYLGQEHEAHVVSRVRIRKEFLSIVRGLLDEAELQFSESKH